MNATSSELRQAALTALAPLGVDEESLHSDPFGDNGYGPVTVEIPAEHWARACTIGGTNWVGAAV